MTMQAVTHPQAPSSWPAGLQLTAFGLCVAHAVFLATAFTLGFWLLDDHNWPIADDFTGFWAAGKLVLQGQGAVYDWDLHKAAAVAAVGHEFAGGYPQFYPPPYFLVVPLVALVPYTLSHLLWVLITPLPYIFVITRIVGDRLGILLALAFPAMLANAMIGQNGCITAALMGGSLLSLQRNRPLVAGVLIGLLTYKPHFGVLIPLALICARQWRAFASAAVTAIALAALSALVLGVDAWAGFIDALLSVNRTVFGLGMHDFAKLQSVFGLVRAAGGSLTLAWALHGTAVAMMVVWVCTVWSGHAPFPLKAAVLGVASVVCSPYAYMYDLVLLAVPAAFLLRDIRDRGLLGDEMIGLAAVCLLLMVFPLFKAPVGVGATWILAGLIARRWLWAGRNPSSEQPRPAAA